MNRLDTFEHIICHCLHITLVLFFPKTTQPTRRKVVQYLPHADDLEVDGHGTHVSGIIVGRKSPDGVSTNEIGIADGVARDAKLAFVDIAFGSSRKFFEQNEFVMIIDFCTIHEHKILH